MPLSKQTLRINAVGGRSGDEARATVIVDRLAERRQVVGDAPEWEVTYDARDVTEAMRLCAADLDELDPSWIEVLDFKAVSIRRPVRMATAPS